MTLSGAHLGPALDAAAWHARQKLDNADSAEMIGTTERMRRTDDERKGQSATVETLFGLL